MSKSSIRDDARAERLAWGRALAKVRQDKRLTQQQAADAARPPMSAQNWGFHETGKVAGIEKRTTLRRLADALGVTVSDLEAERLRTEAEDFSPEREPTRLRSLAGSFGPRPAEDPAPVRRAEFPLSEGQAILIFPADLSPEGFEELSAYLAVFLRTHGQKLTAAS